MEFLFIIFSVVVWVVAIVALVKLVLEIPKDIKTLGDVLGDDPEKREQDVRNENENFIKLMRASEISQTDFLLDEARKNLEYSYNLRAQENQSVFSVTAVLMGLFSAFIYLSKYMAYIVDCRLFWLYFSLSVLCLIVLVIAAVFLFESLKPTYLIPNSTESKSRGILQEGDKGGSADKVSAELKYRLIAQCAVRSKVNEYSNILKSRCWDATRRYMRYAGVFLLLMLLVAGAFKICVSPSGEMLRQLFGCCPCCF